jgi:hypothetical protein
MRKNDSIDAFDAVSRTYVVIYSNVVLSFINLARPLSHFEVSDGLIQVKFIDTDDTRVLLIWSLHYAFALSVLSTVEFHVQIMTQKCRVMQQPKNLHSCLALGRRFPSIHHRSKHDQLYLPVLN